jgi:hypothetical protein
MNPALYCAYCGVPCCGKCMSAPSKGRKKEYLCPACLRFVEDRLDRKDGDRGGIYRGFDEQKMRRNTTSAARFTHCSNPGCNKKIGFRKARICIFCNKGFCDDCLVFTGEFRRTDFICSACAAGIEDAVILSKDHGIPGRRVIKRLGSLTSLRKRSPEAARFFFKWITRERGGNAVLDCDFITGPNGQVIEAHAVSALVEP